MRALLVIVLVLSRVFAMAQSTSAAPPIDFSGTWQGILTQPGNSDTRVTDNYPFWFSFQQHGDTITGFSRIEIANTPHFGVMLLTGKVKGSVLRFTESQLSDATNIPGANWCIKFGSLTFNKTEQSLKGVWKSDATCGPGEIIVFRSNLPFNSTKPQQHKYVKYDELKGKLERKEPSDYLKVILYTVTFATNSTVLSGASEEGVLEVVKLMELHADIQINVLGHTENTGSDERNLTLSIARAHAVADFIVAHGIEASRLTYEGFGKARPLASNDTDAGRKTNRRTEFEVRYRK